MVLEFNLIAKSALTKPLKQILYTLTTDLCLLVKKQVNKDKEFLSGF